MRVPREAAGGLAVAHLYDAHRALRGLLPSSVGVGAKGPRGGDLAEERAFSMVFERAAMERAFSMEFEIEILLHGASNSKPSP